MLHKCFSQLRVVFVTALGAWESKPPYVYPLYMNYTFRTWSLHPLARVGGGMAGVSPGWEMEPKMFPAFPSWVSLRSVWFKSCNPWPACAKLFLGSMLSGKYFNQDVNVPVGFPSLFIGMAPQRFCLSESGGFFLSSPFLNVTPLS